MQRPLAREIITHGRTLVASNPDTGNLTMKEILMRRAMTYLAGALAAVLLMLGAPLAGADDLGKPMLLVASPALQGPYTHTALIVVPMGNKHIGFILNRSTQTPM